MPRKAGKKYRSCKCKKWSSGRTRCIQRVPKGCKPRTRKG